MHSKRIFAAFSVVIALALLLTACGGPAKPPAASGNITIAGVVFQDDQFMNSMVQGFKDAGTKYGVTVLTANTNNDQSKEAELIQTYIAQGVNGIAIAPLSKDASIANLKEAASKGIRIAITNMSISDPSFLAGGFTSDDRSNGKIVGDNTALFIKDKLGGKANVAIVDFDDQLPDQSKARYGGFEDGLKAANVTYTVVAHQSAHLQDDALAATTDMLTAHPEVNVIFACNEGGTIGAAMAVKQAGKAGKVFVFGYDGSDQLTSMILSGDNILVGAVAQDPYTQGYKAVESLVAALKGTASADAGKMTIVPGTYLSATDPAGVNAWRKANGLKEVTTSTSSATGANLTVAGVVFQDDQFMNSMVQGMKDAGAKLGVTVLTANTNNDQSKEAELIQTYIAQGVNGIAIAPLSKDASIANLKEAASKGIKVAITNMSISDPSFLAGGFTSDDRSNGKIVGDNVAKYIQDKLGGTAKVAIVDFDDQLPDQSKARYGGFEDGLKAAGVTYEVVAHQSAHLQDDALAKVTDMLTAHPEIQVIFACNEGGTIGAAMAVKQASLGGKVAVFGYDGSDQLTTMILSGDNILLGTVAQDPYSQGYKAVEALVQSLNNETSATEGKMTIVPGTYLGTSDLEAVKAWRTANGLK